MDVRLQVGEIVWPKRAVPKGFVESAYVCPHGFTNHTECDGGDA